MVKFLLAKAWSMRAQFVKYFAIGISGVVLDMFTLWFLKSICGLSAIMSVIINQIFLINYVFILNKFWAFKAVGMAHRQIIKFYILAFGNYLFSIGWMWIFNEHLGYHYLLVRMVNIAMAVSWNFLLYKYFVYKV
jgi:putative flippase GtrA